MVPHRKRIPQCRLQKRTTNADRHLKEGLPVVSKLCETSSILGVAITGSLASGSSVEGADLDLLIVTKADYAVRVRALAVYLEHNARVKTRICPNMVLDRKIERDLLSMQPGNSR